MLATPTSLTTATSRSPLAVPVGLVTVIDVPEMVLVIDAEAR